MSIIQTLDSKLAPTRLFIKDECLVFVIGSTQSRAWLLRQPLSTAFVIEFTRTVKSFFGADFKQSQVKILANSISIQQLSLEFERTGVQKIDISSKVVESVDCFIHWTEKKLRFKNEVNRSLKKKTRVLIVDDSPTIRKLLTSVFSSDPSLEVVGSASLPSQVEKLIIDTQPDVVTLDIHMPEMTGVELLRQLFPKHPLPYVMITSVNIEDSTWVFDSMDAGAVDFIQKPSLEDLKTSGPVMIEKIKAAAKANIRRPSQSRQTPSAISSFSSANLSEQLIAIGSSTGGTEALKELFIRMPEDIPPILVVQHIPPVFSAALASRLNQLCKFEVREAKEGDLVEPNVVLIAPGGMQMKVKKDSQGHRIVIDDSAPVNRHKPSVDYLFESLAELKICKNTIGVILTGMGADGAKGLLKLKENGARTIGQDQDSCVVYGMPRAAFELGAVERVASLTDIPKVIADYLRPKKRDAA